MHGVKPLVEGWVDALGWAGEAMAGHGVWFVALVVSVLVAVAGVLAEWQRRVTLLALVEKAPPALWWSRNLVGVGRRCICGWVARMP